MSNSFELKPFQWAAVRAVCDGLAGNRNVFALADEVGLGKTLVCAEVAHQLIAMKGHQKRNLIFYVAPSIELLHQNLASIARYMRTRCGSNFEVRTSVSRLSKVPLALAPHSDKQGRSNPKN